MTSAEFARKTGYTTYIISNACRTGKIPCKRYNGKYDIDSSLVPVWRAKRKKLTVKKGGNIHNSSVLYQSAVDEYNAKHGTDLSYGQAVAKGVITDE